MVFPPGIGAGGRFPGLRSSRLPTPEMLVNRAHGVPPDPKSALGAASDPAGASRNPNYSFRAVSAFLASSFPLKLLGEFAAKVKAFLALSRSPTFKEAIPK